MNKLFVWPCIISVASLGLIGYLQGSSALFIAVLLVALEVSLSFDNAVVNARVLMRMTPVWQQRFLTWGMFFAVFLTRAVLPIIIVAVSVWANPLTIATLAFADPKEYGNLLEGAHYVINSFGAVFLLLVGLKYFFDDAKDTHWLEIIEKYLSRWGSVAAIEIAVVLILLLSAAIILAITILR